MSRIASFAAWLFGAAASAAAYWYAVVYVLDEFDHGYGQDNWFLLNLYLSALSVVAGFVGYAAVSFFRAPPRALVRTSLAGIAFTVAELALVSVLERAFPGRDVVAAALAGALVIGALSSLVLRPRAA